MRVEVLQVGRHGETVGREQRACVEVENGIDIQPGGISEKLTQTPEQPAFAVIVKTLVENFVEFGRAERQADRPIGIARQIRRQTVEAPEVGNEHCLAKRAQGIGAVEKVLLMDGVARGQLAQGHFHQDDRGFAFHVRFAHEEVKRAFLHVEGRFRHRKKAAALDQDGLVIKDLGPLHRFALGGEHRRLGQALLHQLQRHQPVVHLGEGGARETDHIHFHPLPGQIVQQRSNQRHRLLVVVERAVEQIHAYSAQGFLLANAFLVQRPHVDEDFRGLSAGLRLEADAKPAVSALVACGYRVGKDKETSLFATRPGQALQQQAVLVIEHRLGSVNRVAYGHVVSGDGFGHGARRAARAEETAGHLLSRADLGEGAVAAGVVVDALGLLVGV